MILIQILKVNDELARCIVQLLNCLLCEIFRRNEKLARNAPNADLSKAPMENFVQKPTQRV